MAPNSDSTLMNSHGVELAAGATIAERSSTMCVCGEIGYAGITSGLQSATERRDPARALHLLKHLQPPPVGEHMLMARASRPRCCRPRRGPEKRGLDRVLATAG